jgi:hypothetical protein
MVSRLTFGSFWILGSLKAAIVDILEVVLCREWADERRVDEERLDLMLGSEIRLR